MAVYMSLSLLKPRFAAFGPGGRGCLETVGIYGIGSFIGYRASRIGLAVTAITLGMVWVQNGSLSMGNIQDNGVGVLA